MANQDIELSWILAAIRRWWWVIALTTIFAVGLAFAVTSRMPPTYEATAVLLISPAQSSTASQYNDLMASERLALTYSKMLKDQPVLATVKEQIGLKQSTTELAENILAEPINNTQLIRLSVSDGDPARAALIANSVAQAFKARIEKISAERYDSTIKNAQSLVNDLQTQIGEQEVQIETLQSKKVEKDVLLANKQVALDALWKDYQLLQTNQQEIDLNIASATGNVYIFEAVKLFDNPTQGTKTASAIVSVGQFQSIGGASPTNTNPALTFTQLIIQAPLLEQVIKELGLQETPDQLAARISIRPVDGTQLIQILVDDPDAARAEQIGKALVNAFIVQVKDLLTEPYADRQASIQTRLGDTGKSIDAAQSEIGKLTTEISQMEAEINRQELSITEKRTDLREGQKNLEDARSTSVESSDTVVISEPAEAPKKPSQNLLLYVAVAGLLGMCLGAGLVFVLGSIDDRIKNEQDVRKGVDLPILGTVRLFDRDVDELVLRSHPVSGPADDFRVLGAHIRRICEEEKLHTLLVTSPTPGNGKSVVTSNLALALAKTSLNIIAVDGDLRLPRLHTIFGLAQEDGFSNSLPGGKFNGCLKNTQLNGLKVITSGEVPPNPAELLTSPNLGKLIKGLTTVANIVLIDCPPVLTTADASILASVVDGVVVVLKAGKTDSQAAKSAAEVLRRVKANVVGIVLNAVPERKEEYYGHYRTP